MQGGAQRSNSRDTHVAMAESASERSRFRFSVQLLACKLEWMRIMLPLAFVGKALDSRGLTRPPFISHAQADRFDY